jgi:uncharacterized protein (DUF1786 family)
MQILCVDIGTGTQDVLLFRAGLGLENALKLVLPSPTMIIRDRIRHATAAGRPVVLSGEMMGGGPCHWAAEAHLRAGFHLYATPKAARTFNDDLDWVQHHMGVVVVSEDEAADLDGAEVIHLRDFNFQALVTALAAFDVVLEPALTAVAVFDHGAAPPEVSDRQFRLDYLADTILTANRLSAFAYLAGDIPPFLTRMRSVVASSAGVPGELLVMDTAPAAVLGATLDPAVVPRSRRLIANIGNFHTLCFLLGPHGIDGLFEHHTGLIHRPRLEELVLRLATGELTHQEVFDEHGHGAWLRPEKPPLAVPAQASLTVTGPRRSMLKGSKLAPYFAVPYGDMMITGCFGLLRAAADLVPSCADIILEALAGAGADTPPWELN